MINPYSFLTGLNQQALTTGRPLSPAVTAGVRSGQISGLYNLAAQQDALSQQLGNQNNQAAYYANQVELARQQLAQQRAAQEAQQAYEAEQMAQLEQQLAQQQAQHDAELAQQQAAIEQSKQQSAQQAQLAQDAQSQAAQSSMVSGAVGALGAGANLYKLAQGAGLIGSKAATTAPALTSTAPSIDSLGPTLSSYGNPMPTPILDTYASKVLTDTAPQVSAVPSAVSSTPMGSTVAPTVQPTLAPTPGASSVYGTPTPAPVDMAQAQVASKPYYMTDTAPSAYSAAGPASNVAPAISEASAVIPGLSGAASGTAGLGLGASGTVAADLSGLGAPAAAGATELAGAAAYPSLAAMPATAWLGPAAMAAGVGYTIYNSMQNRTLGKDQALSGIGSGLQYLNRASQPFTGEGANSALAAWRAQNPNGPALTGDPSFRGGMDPNGSQDTLDTVVRYANSANLQPDQFKKLFSSFSPQQMAWFQSMYNADPNVKENPNISAAAKQLQTYGGFFNDPNSPWNQKKDDLGSVSSQDMQNYWGGTAGGGSSAPSGGLNFDSSGYTQFQPNAPTGGVYDQASALGSQLLGRDWRFPADWPTNLGLDQYKQMIQNSSEYLNKANQAQQNV